jgi:hypothetical protein
MYSRYIYYISINISINIYHFCGQQNGPQHKDTAFSALEYQMATLSIIGTQNNNTQH